MPLDLSMIGSKFPALRHPVIFFDNPGGTQVAQPVLDRMNAYLVEHNANHGGAFETSCASDAVLDEACTFSRNDTRFKLRMDSLEWLYGYTAIFQAIRIDRPGDTPNIPERYRRVFKRIERGIFELAPYGKRLLEEELYGDSEER